jgi:hypothetical protein
VPSSSNAVDLDGMAVRSVAADFSMIDGGRVLSAEDGTYATPYICSPQARAWIRAFATDYFLCI